MEASELRARECGDNWQPGRSPASVPGLGGKAIANDGGVLGPGASTLLERELPLVHLDWLHELFGQVFLPPAVPPLTSELQGFEREHLFAAVGRNKMHGAMFGLLNLNKPSYWTSRDVVNRVQRLTARVKAGHAGTLDPLATGVLIVCLGPATRLIERIQRMPKRYRGTFLLGRTSNTEDIEGQICEIRHAARPSADLVRSVLPQFRGEIEQVPPAFSALKVQGQRAYKLARSGQDFELKARKIVIHELELLRYDYPELTLDITCGSGTYVRSLGRDIAVALGTGSVMSALIRTAIGPFPVDDAVDVESLTKENLPPKLLSPLLALSDLPQIVLHEQERQRLANGLTIHNRWAIDGSELAAIDSHAQLCSIVAPRQDQQLRPIQNFPTVT